MWKYESLLWEYEFLQELAPGTLVMSILCAYDKWLWKFPILRFLVKIPDISGQYSGEIKYHRDNQDQSKSCCLKIQQTASQIKVKCSFDRQKENSTFSESKEALLIQDDLGNHSLLYYYYNEGSYKAGDTLDQHDGLTRLNISSAHKKIELEGYYFTRRNPQTKGRIKVTKE